MNCRYAVSLVLNAHFPFVRECPARIRRSRQPLKNPSSGNCEKSVYNTEIEYLPDEVDLIPGSVEESSFFEAVSETYLPLLGIFDRLEEDHVPFRLGVALSPVLGQMLSDNLLMKKYLAFLDRQIDFGKSEIKRLRNNHALQTLAKRYLNDTVDRHAAFITRYDGNILKALDYYRKKGKIEILAVPATHVFLPFICHICESVRAQVETAVVFYRDSFGIRPQGFWLPELGWTRELDPLLRSYGFGYTVTDSHGLVFGNPPPSRGAFFPVKTPHGVFVLGRDFNAASDVAGFQDEGLYRDNNRDIGYELPSENTNLLLSRNGARCPTGYKYRKTKNNGIDDIYEPEAAQAAAENHVRVFLENIYSRVTKASRYMKEVPVSLCAFNADSFGRFWHEGHYFLENIFRLAAEYRELQFLTPSEYLDRQPVSSIEVSVPEFSSWTDNGYAEVLLDSSNDWIYRHINRAVERMVELADRFYEDTGLKERALNQAAREILLAQASDWPVSLYRRENTEYARRCVEGALQNFTRIYEALGCGHIDTEWLTNIERRHNIFRNINFRTFMRNR